MRRAALLGALALAGACDRGQPREAAPPPLPPTTAGATPAAPAAGAQPGTGGAAADAGCALPDVPVRYPAPRRLVAIGDLHGDLAATRAALRLAGAIDAADRWAGGDLVIVQVGDILDRGDDEQAIIDLFLRLEVEARAAGGAVIVLLGNHELMNAAGDFRYVTPGAIADFDDVPGLDLERWRRVPPQLRGRIAALGPGGVYAKKLAAHNVVAIVGDAVFSHAGVLGGWVARVDEANRTSRCWLDGQAGGPEAAPATLTDDTSPLWTRAIGLDPPDCAAAKDALARLGVARIVIGHTVQDTGVTSACDGAVWRIDVGLSKRYGGPIEVLEMVPGQPPRVLQGAR